MLNHSTSCPSYPTTVVPGAIFTWLKTMKDPTWFPFYFCPQVEGRSLHIAAVQYFRTQLAFCTPLAYKPLLPSHRIYNEIQALSGEDPVCSGPYLHENLFPSSTKPYWPTFFLLNEEAKFCLLQTLHLLFPLSGMLFPQISMWLVCFGQSGLSSSEISLSTWSKVYIQSINKYLLSA